ncbi:MAG TPA: hypothetical protein DDW16_01895 [Clostridiales bacterium]|nr:hypothetical protein [Clostridiales bacterium]
MLIFYGLSVCIAPNFLFFKTILNKYFLNKKGFLNFLNYDKLVSLKLENFFACGIILNVHIKI